MHQESLLHLPLNPNERLFKFTILTPHTFLPPNHSESLEDELAEEFAQFLCDRVATVLGERSYTPHHDGEAFLNMRFNEFEERFLRHSDYTIFITSGRNAACLDLIYPRMLVFLTIRPTWRNRGIILYVGPPMGQKLFDQDLFANKPLIFPLNKEEWGPSKSLWDKLMGTLQSKFMPSAILPLVIQELMKNDVSNFGYLQVNSISNAKVPLTPEPKRSKAPQQKPPIKRESVETNGNKKGMASMSLNQSEAEAKAPITSRVCGTQLSGCASESIWSSKKGFSTPPFAHSSSLSPFRSHFRQREHNSNSYWSLSLNDMCLLGNIIRCQNKKPRTKKEQRRRFSDSVLPKKEGHETVDYLCFPSRFKMKKKKRLMTEPTPTQQTEQTSVKTPEVIRVSIPDISDHLKPRKALQTYCLQVKIDDDSLKKGSSSHSALSSPPSKRKTNSLSSGRRSKLRCDSGIASNFSFVSTDISSSSPSLCYPQHSDSLIASPSTFFSSSSPSCLDNYETDQDRSHTQKHSLDPSLLRSIHSQSSITAQYIATLEDSLKFVDDEDPNDEIIRSEQRRVNEKNSFFKPGMPPLKDQNEYEVEAGQSQFFEPQIMNPDSKASSDSIEDPTLIEDCDVEFLEDLPLQSDVGQAQSCDEQKNQGAEISQDLSMKYAHSDKKISRENISLTLLDNTDSQQGPKLEGELLLGMHFDAQISQEQCQEKVAESTDLGNKAHPSESEDFKLTRKNSRRELTQNQEFFVNPFDPDSRAQNTSENKVAQENVEFILYNAPISPTKADNFKTSFVSLEQSCLENENKLTCKQTFLVHEDLQQPEIINNQLQEQSKTMTEPTPPSVVLLGGVNSNIKPGDIESELLGSYEKSPFLENIRASKPNKKYSKVQESVDSGLGDSSKTVEKSACPQSDMIFAAKTESIESNSLSEESILLPVKTPLDHITNLLVLEEKVNPKYQGGPLQDLHERTPETTLITTLKTNYLECLPPESQTNNRAVPCQKSLSVSSLEGYATPEHLSTDTDQTSAKQDISCQQNRPNCQSVASNDSTLTGMTDSFKTGLPESDDKRSDACEQRCILGGEVCPKPKRRSILFDRDRSDNVLSQEACKVLREMLKDPTPETLQLVQHAVKTYDQYPGLSDSIAPTIMSALKPKLPTARVKKPTFIRRMFPHISIAIFNLSTAYIPRYLATIYDYSMSSITTGHPDSRLLELATTIQEAFLNHPLGVPFLLAGTTLLSPWLLRQFPLTLLATCAAAPDALRRLLAQPSTSLAGHLTDISEVFHAAPIWTTFAVISGRSAHWRLVRPS